MEKVIENKVDYELIIIEAEWWLLEVHYSSPLLLYLTFFQNKKKKKLSMTIPWMQVPWVPHQFLGSFLGDISLYASNWACRKLCRAPETGAMPPLVGSWLRGMKTNQLISRGKTEKGREDEGGIPKTASVLAAEMPSSCQCLSSTWLNSQTSWVQCCLHFLPAVLPWASYLTSQSPHL